MKPDAWNLYRAVFRELFPSPSVRADDIVSPAVLQEMVDRLLAARPEGLPQEPTWEMIMALAGQPLILAALSHAATELPRHDEEALWKFLGK